jgi:hypothetical protein
MHGAALVRIPNPIAQSEATSPRPFIIGATDSASRSRPVALALLRRLPIAFAVARFNVIPAKAGIRPSIEVSVNCGPGQIRACAGTTEFGR